MNAQPRHAKQTENHVCFFLLFPVAIVYYEILFGLFTAGGGSFLGAVCNVLFSFAYGMVPYLLLSISHNRKLNHVLSCVCLGLLAVPYLVECFVYRQFKVVYDLNTVTGGAGDMLGGFMGETVRMVFSWFGIALIVLYLLPTVLLAVLGRRCIVTAAATAVRRYLAAGAMVACYGISLLCVTCYAPCRAAYTDEYNFQSAVRQFGLLTGARLDIKNHLFGNKQDGFETPTGGTVTTTTTTTSTTVSSVTGTTGTTTARPQEYGFNQMDLKLDGGTGNVKNLNEYVASLTPSKKNAYTGLFRGKNLIMITAEAFTAEVIDPELTPTLYRMATKGIQFTDYYQPASAGTTGGEYQNIFGMLPTAGGKSFKNTADNLNYFTMGSQLDRLGYYGKAYHNNSYTYYSRHQTHTNLGYSDGFMGYGNGIEKLGVKNCWPQSDLEMLDGTLDTYIDKQPFNIYYMSVSGHSAYTRVGNSMTARNWDKVAHLTCSDTIKGYYAANLEFEYAMAHLLSELEAKGIADDTVVCIATDHFPYGLDEGGKLGKMPFLSELYGYDVKTIFQRDHSRLILWCGSLEDGEPIVVDTPTSGLDILPTLSNLFGTEFDSRLMVGRDVFSDAEALVFNLNYEWKTELGTYEGGKFTPKDDTVTIPDGYVERIKTVVRNKIRYCTWALDNDYYRHLFG